MNMKSKKTHSITMFFFKIFFKKFNLFSKSWKLKKSSVWNTDLKKQTFEQQCPKTGTEVLLESQHVKNQDKDSLFVKRQFSV